MVLERKYRQATARSPYRDQGILGGTVSTLITIATDANVTPEMDAGI